MEKSNIVCACGDVTVGNMLSQIKTNPEIMDMDMEFRLEQLDIGQACECCLEDDCDIIETNYKEVLEAV